MGHEHGWVPVWMASAQIEPNTANEPLGQARKLRSHDAPPHLHATLKFTLMFQDGKSTD
jgi:hypothetical protein